MMSRNGPGGTARGRWAGFGGMLQPPCFSSPEPYFDDLGIHLPFVLQPLSFFFNLFHYLFSDFLPSYIWRQS